MVSDNLNINGQLLRFVSSIDHIRIADSFVARANKIGSANGEAKLYVGQDTSAIWNFFGPPGFEITCFFEKQNLLDFIQALREEYNNPSQNYRNSNPEQLKKLWGERNDKVINLDEFEFFDAFEQEQIRGPRVYLKSKSKVFSLMRELALPGLSQLTINKFINKLGHEYYQFKIDCSSQSKSSTDKSN